MKRFTVGLILIIQLVFVCAFAEPIGFGYVNDTDVAIRRGVRGDVLARLPKDTSVWVKESRTDDNGTLWYHVNAGLHVDYKNIDYDGWMKAEFITAGDELWHDVVSISASNSGIIAIHSDGTIDQVGKRTIDRDHREQLSRSRNAKSPVKQVLAIESDGYAQLRENGEFFFSAVGYDMDRVNVMGEADGYVFCVTQDGRLVCPFDSTLSLDWVYPTDGLSKAEMMRITKIVGSYSRVLLLSNDGQISVMYLGDDLDKRPEPDWSSWNHIKDVFVGWMLIYPSHASAAYVGIRDDGSIVAVPQELDDKIGNWTRMKQVALTTNWILGLKEDGTVISIGLKSAPPDLSTWENIIQIDSGLDYCVGLREDGSLVFAGEHIFMRAGHTRK